MKDQIIESWFINNRVNLMILDAVSDEGLNCTLSKRGGRNVAMQFAHLHNVRLWRIEAYAKEFMKGQFKIDREKPIDKSLLQKRLTESADAIAKWLELGFEDSGKVKGFKRGLIPMLSYMIAHESHHRGSILLTLKESGFALPKDVRDGIWAWNQI
ncbi:MAG: hypothetical protein KKD86_17550 [Bacteroidetes bacterium]|nr:hypothetical protein [Bacteroidota bacterium]MBU1680632.1 hypothetical protein [Bacteroidota bacterium]